MYDHYNQTFIALNQVSSNCVLMLEWVEPYIEVPRKHFKNFNEPNYCK